jgi:hypothetical protein
MLWRVSERLASDTYLVLPRRPNPFRIAESNHLHVAVTGFTVVAIIGPWARAHGLSGPPSYINNIRVRLYIAPPFTSYRILEMADLGDLISPRKLC